jgi:hypothetical protein
MNELKQAVRSHLFLSPLAAEPTRQDDGQGRLASQAASTKPQWSWTMPWTTGTIRQSPDQAQYRRDAAAVLT